MTSIERLRGIADTLTPALEEVFSTELREQLNTPHLDSDLVLRDDNCIGAVALVGRYLSTSHGIDARPMSARLLCENHAVLQVGDIFIDPTWSQFFKYVDLTARGAARNEAWRALYPGEPKIAVFKSGSTEFIDMVAETAESIDTGGEIPRMPRDFVTQSLLRGKTLRKKRQTYADVWNPEAYSPMLLPSHEDAIVRAAAMLVKCGA